MFITMHVCRCHPFAPHGVCCDIVLVSKYPFTVCQIRRISVNQLQLMVLGGTKHYVRGSDFVLLLNII